MTPQRWNEVSRLYEAARARAPRERAAFLAEACGSDATLRWEVQSLLDQPTSPPGLEGLTPLVVTQAMEDAPRPALTGRRFGDYLVGEHLDSGGMGDVYRARDTRLGRDVAIKVLQPVFAGDEDRLARFEREARLLAALDHPHIGAIHGVAESDGTRALVLALVEGETLAERLARGAIPMAEALEYARQIAEALEAAHDKGIVHRDLKPRNLKITRTGVVKVLDFGLAKLLGPSAGHDAPDLAQPPARTLGGTQEGLILGSAAYMSPEQARGLPVDKRADVWAFGCVLYEMVTGRVAFGGETVSDTITAILGRDVDWNALPASTPQSVRRLLRRCLAKDAARRLRDIADAKLDLDEADEPVPSEARHRESSWVGRVGWVAAALFSLATMALGAAMWARSSSVGNRTYRTELLMPAGFDRVGPPGRFALSPDGRRIAFTARDDGGARTRLYVRGLDESMARPLAGTEGAEHPFWSPDSRMIAFFADRKLKKIAASGGASFTLSDAGRFVQGGTWSRDNVILFTFGAGPLFRVAAGGGKPQPVTTLDANAGETGHAFPFFLPDGKRFLYTSYTTQRTVADRGEYVGGVYVASLDSTDRTRLLDRVSNAEYARGQVLFVRDGALLAQRLDLTRMMTTGEPVVLAEEIHLGVAAAQLGAFSASGDGVLAFEIPVSPGGSQLVWVDRRGRRIGPLGNFGNYENEVELSPDGTHVLVARSERGEAPHLVVFDLAQNLERRLTSGSAARMAVWSPDGTQVAFGRRNNQGPNDLYVSASSGATVENLLLHDAVNTLPESWSLDGRFLLYQRGPDIWVLPLFGEHRPFPFLVSPAEKLDARFSPDGRWVAYSSSESGRFEIYVSPFSSTDAGRNSQALPKWLVSTGAAHAPRWRRDGTEIFYWSSDSNKLMAVPVRAEGTRLTVGRVEPLFDARPRLESLPFTFYDVSADGQRFVVNGVEEPNRAASLELIVNWPAR